MTKIISFTLTSAHTLFAREARSPWFCTLCNLPPLTQYPSAKRGVGRETRHDKGKEPVELQTYLLGKPLTGVISPGPCAPP